MQADIICHPLRFQYYFTTSANPTYSWFQVELTFNPLISMPHFMRPACYGLWTAPHSRWIPDFTLFLFEFFARRNQDKNSVRFVVTRYCLLHNIDSLKRAYQVGVGPHRICCWCVILILALLTIKEHCKVCLVTRRRRYRQGSSRHLSNACD